MTKGMKDGLGLLCFAAIGFVISLAGGEESPVAEIAGAVAVVLAVIGFGMIAWNLARN